MKKLLTLCLLLGAFACKSDDDKLMVPKIEATDIAVDAKGGEGAVGYRLLNAAAGEKVEATADADWITDIAVATTSSVSRPRRTTRPRAAEPA